MDNYFTILATSLGVPFWLVIILLIWSTAWKLVALWKSAQNKHLIWFIVIALVNTIGILPILYIFVFSKMGKSQKKKKNKKDL